MFKAVVFAAVSLLVIQHVGAQVAINTCRVSGDPHYTGWSNVRHDFQGVGVWQMVENDQLNVQSEFIACNPNARRPVTCIRRSTVQFSLFGIGDITISWGRWGNTIDDLVVTETPEAGSPSTTTYNVQSSEATSGITLRSGVMMVYNPNNGRLTVSRSNFDAGTTRVVLGRALLVVELPANPTFLGATRGLCGLYSGTASNMFTGHDDVLYVANTVAGRRYNGPQVNMWGLTYGVEAGGVIEPLAFRHGDQFKLMMDPPTPTAPTDEEQAALEGVAFATETALEEAEAECAAIAAVSKADGYDCMYDFAITGDATVSLSGGDAIAAANEVTGQNSSSDDTLGIVLGSVFAGVAAVSVVVALFTYKRLRTVRQQYSRALVARNESSSPFGSSAGSSSEIRVEDNI